jgi:fibronectin-binding autotransporter adhesin
MHAGRVILSRRGIRPAFLQPSDQGTAGELALGRMSNRRICFGLGVSLLALAAAAPALGATVAWTDGTGSWFTGGNWDIGVPGTGDDVIVGNHGTPQINGAANVQTLQIINGSAVDLQTGGSLTANGGILVGGPGTSNGTLTLSGSTNINGAMTWWGAIINAQTTGTLSNTISLNGGFGSFINASPGATITLAGPISGGSLTFQGGGTTVLTGANTTTGVFAIEAGANLQIGNGGASGNLGSGTLLNSGTLTFNRSNTLTVDNTIIGGGAVNFNSGTTIYTGQFNGQASTWTIASGAIAQIGTGGTGAGLFNPATIVNNGSLIFARDVEYDGVIGGSGSVAVAGGTTILTGASNYSGGTTISGGTLQFGTGADIGTVTGNVFNNSVLLINGRGQLAANISGGGSLTQMGNGQIGVLTGTNTYSGGTTVQTGSTLQIGNGGTTGSIVGNVSLIGSVQGGLSSLTFKRSDTIIFSGTVTGNGYLSQNGAGTLVLTGNSNYTGSTNIASGTLQVGNGGTTGSIVGNIFNNAALVFDRADAMTFAGAISGSGSLTKLGADALILTGASSYTGNTVVNSGVLQLGNGGTTGSIAGNLTNNGVLAFNRSDEVSFAGAISGSGAVRQIGAGVTTLSANSTYSGGTSVNTGTLNVTGSIVSSAVGVASGAKLTGIGTVGAVTVASGGTMSPGSGGAPGTLTVQGNLTLASGANYVDAISPTVTGLTSVSGTASINGALMVNAATGSYTVGQRYNLLSAAGGLSGTFASVNTTGLNAYRTSVGYDANSVFLTLSANALAPLLPAGMGANGISAAKAIDAAIAGGATVNNGFNALFGLSGAALGSAVAQLPGEAGADAAQAGSQAFLPFMSLLTAEGVGGSSTVTAANFAPGGAYGGDGAPKPAQLAAGSTRVWGTVFGRHTGIAADRAAGTQSVKAGNAGFAAGVDMQVTDTLRLGAAAGGGHGSFNAGNGRGASDDAMLGLYGNLGVMDQGYVAGVFSYGWHDVDTLRLLTVSGTDLLSAKYTAHDVGVRIEGGWRVALDDADGLVPYAAFAWDAFQTPNYGEHAVSGSSNFALSYAAQDTNFGQSELGLKAGRTIAMGDGMMAMELSAAWAHQLYGAPLALAAFQSLPGSGFVVQGGRIATNTALLGAGLDWQARDGLSFGARIDSQLGGGTTALAGTGTVSLRW